jgi:hypothetical protein
MSTAWTSSSERLWNTQPEQREELGLERAEHPVAMKRDRAPGRLEQRPEGLLTGTAHEKEDATGDGAT